MTTPRQLASATRVSLVRSPGSILVERWENDCSAINLSWILSAAERWRSVSTSSRLPASGARTLILAIVSSGAFTRSASASATAREFPSSQLDLPQKGNLKALGPVLWGIRWARDGSPVNRARRGQACADPAQEQCRQRPAALLGLVDFDVSLTHSRTDAMAIVVGMKREAADSVSDTVDREGEFGSSERC